MGRAVVRVSERLLLSALHLDDVTIEGAELIIENGIAWVGLTLEGDPIPEGCDQVEVIFTRVLEHVKVRFDPRGK